MSKRAMALAFGLIFPLPVYLDAETLIEEIQNAAKLRRERYTQGIVKWTEERLVTAGGLARAGLAEKGYGDNDTPIPDGTVSHTNHRLFGFKNEMVRYQGSESVWNVARAKFTPIFIDAAFDGRVAKTLRRRPETVGVRPDLGVISSSSHDVLKWSASLPVCAYFRPGTSANQRDPLRTSDLRATNHHDVVAGRASNEFVDSQRELRVWFADDAACVVTRVQRLAKSIPFETTDIEYDLETGFPRSWSTTRKQMDGSLRERTISTIQEIDITTTIPDANFQVSFPENTYVRDTIKSNTYIFRSSGKNTPVNLAMIQSAREYEAIRDRRSPRIRSWIVLGCTTISVVVLLALWRWLPRVHH